jgi:uncharacterized protein YjdB
MKTFNLYKGLGLLVMGAAIALTGTSCSDDDTSTLKAAVVPSSISFDLPDELEQLIYTDASGSDCLPLIKGQSVTLSYVLEPDSATFKDVTWTSSNPAIASVTDSGVVTALSGGGIGYSMVQVAPVGIFSGSGINAVLKVVVSDELVPADSITINSTADELYGGDTLHLSATVSPDDATYKTVQWSSSNTDVATVDSKGVLTAMTTSTTTATVTITATALDGSGVVATKTITVRQIVQPQDISIDQTYSADNGYECAMNEATLTLSYTTTPAECTTSLIEWTSSDPTVATVDDGVVTFVGYGETTITATCPETGNSSSIKLSIPVGLIRETYHNPDHYVFYNAKQSGNGTSSSHVWHDGYLTITTYTQNATNQRADIKCWETPISLHAGNYPILAIKMDDVKDLGYGITSRNITADMVGTSTSGTSYKALGNGANKYTYDYKCSDGSHVFIYDLTATSFGTGGLAPTNEAISFTTFQFKYADMRTIDHQITYNLYWVQTFKSLSALQEYLTNVDQVTYE